MFCVIFVCCEWYLCYICVIFVCCEWYLCGVLWYLCVESEHANTTHNTRICVLWVIFVWYLCGICVVFVLYLCVVGDICVLCTTKYYSQHTNTTKHHTNITHNTQIPLVLGVIFVCCEWYLYVLSDICMLWVIFVLYLWYLRVVNDICVVFVWYNRKQGNITKYH